MNDPIKHISAVIELLRNDKSTEAIGYLERWQRELEYSTEHQKQMVLVLDDNVEILALLEEYLSELGFHALLCHSLEQARELINQCVASKQALTFALLDIMLRTDHGHKLIPDLVECFPSIKVIFISGHAPEQQLMTVGMPSVIGVLQKPFGLAALKEILS